MDVRGKVLLQLFNKSKLRNGTKTFIEPIFSLFIVKFKKLGFSTLSRHAHMICTTLIECYFNFTYVTL